ncbi:MAG: hypothetical protein ACJ78Z_03000 [Myxococcales bacterium]
MRKADPSSSRRTLRRRTPTAFPASPAPASDLDRRARKAGERSTESRLDSDFGICLCVVPALRRRSDA